MFPDNPVAQESVAAYLATLKTIFERIADGGRKQGPPDSRARQGVTTSSNV
jgi:hypothetical protein